MGLNEDLELLEELRDEGDRVAEANLLFRIGSTYTKKGETEEALAAFQAAYDICRLEKNHQGRLEIVRRVVPLLIELRKLEEAATGVSAGRELAEKQNNLAAVLDFMDLESQVMWLTGESRRAVELLIMAADICSEHQDWIGRFLMLEKAAPLLRQAGRYADALRIYAELTELADKADDQGRLALALVGQGEMLRQLNRPEQALKALVSAYGIYKIIGHVRYIELVTKAINDLEKQLATNPSVGS